MRKHLTIYVIAILALIVLPAEAANIKAGSVCSKIGQTQISNGYKFICIKSGKKSVWDKGTPLKSSSSISTPTPKQSLKPNTSIASPYFEVKLPLNLDIPDLNPSNAKLLFDSNVSIAARKDFLSRLSNRSFETPNIEWVVDPDADPVKIEQYKKEVPYAVQFYNSVVPAKTPLRVYIGSSANFQWLYDNLKRDLAPDGLEGNWLEAKLARSKVEEGFHGGAGGLKTKEGKAVLFFNYGKWDSIYETLQTQISFHEYTHTVQKGYLSGSMASMLCWMREGYANYMGYNLITRYSTAAYLNSWYQAFQYADQMPDLAGWRTRSAQDWTQWFMDNEKKTPFDCDSYDNYTYGSMAWEYIHGTYGGVAVDKFFRGLSTSYVGVCSAPADANFNVCPGWKKLYVQVFGNAPEEDYVKFGKHIYEKIIWINRQKGLAGDSAKILAPPPWTIASKY